MTNVIGTLEPAGFITLVMEELGERIRIAREAKKLSQAAIAKTVGISQAAIQKIEKGSSRKSKWLPEVMAAVGLKPEVPLVGTVGAGALAHYYATADDPGEMVTAPEGFTASTVAVEIRGESLGALFDRWLVFYDDRREPVTDDLIGKLCVVALADDRVLVKQLKRSRTKGLYHLISNTEAPILDAEVVWAARVKTMVPRE